MYALEQLFVVATVLAWIRLTQSPGAAWGATVPLVVLGWLAVFSHLSAALLIPAFALVALIQFGRRLIGV